MNAATRARVKTILAVCRTDGIGRASTRYRRPRACTGRRIASSGPVSRRRLACIDRRVTGEVAHDCPTAAPASRLSSSRPAPRATALLAELKSPARGFSAVVIGEPHRAFYGNQYGLTFPIFEHYGVPLWVPRQADRPEERGPRPGHVRVQRDEQG
jgi:hypothetical protein